MSRFTIYLAGPMDKMSIKDQTGWRNECEEFLSDLDVRVLNPCRRPHTADLINREIFNLDIKDIDESDLLLMDCRALSDNVNVKMFGTPCEVFYMNHILKRPTIGWYNEDSAPSGINVFADVLIDRMFPSLQEALDHIAGFYL
jgi:nucleoside 2-deoxyribosyltransferase